MMVQLTLAYMLMLVAMAYNAGARMRLTVARCDRAAQACLLP